MLKKEKHRRLKFNYDEIDLIESDMLRVRYGLIATVYSVELYITKLSNSECKAISQKIRRLCKQYTISALWVYSTTATDDDLQLNYTQSARGRPKRVIQGNKVEKHLHIAMIGNELVSAKQTAKRLKKYFDKRYSCGFKADGTPIKVSKIESKGCDYHAFNYCGYMLKQADEIHQAGDFNLADYYNSRK